METETQRAESAETPTKNFEGRGAVKAAARELAADLPEASKDVVEVPFVGAEDRPDPFGLKKDGEIIGQRRGRQSQRMAESATGSPAHSTPRRKLTTSQVPFPSSDPQPQPLIQDQRFRRSKTAETKDLQRFGCFLGNS
jgi:hypothetical protein